MHTRIAIGLMALTAGSLSVPASAKVLKPVPDATLDGLRGGFISAGGLVFDIGITTSTYINGQLALKTSIATSPTAPTGPTGPTGPTAPTAAGGNQPPPAVPPPAGPAPAPTVTISTSGPGATPANGSSEPPAGAAPGPSTQEALGPSSGPAPGPAPAAPVGGPAPQIQAPQDPGPQSPAAEGQTVTASTPDGQTTVIQNPGQLVNLVTNAANGQDIRLDTVVNLVLPGFDAVQRNQLLSGMGMKMGADGSFGLVSALPH